ncbi:MAG: hypothetical protein SGJ10_13185 [Bacteroidota bacterium]|nr:hypothetical protein [Bacteroidota bacterium]
MPIQTAIDNDWITLKLEGAFDKKVFAEVIDQNGVHYGKCIVGEIKNKLDSEINIQIDNGLELISTDTAVQNTVITKRVQLQIAGKKKIRFKMYAMGIEMKRQVPLKGIPFLLGSISSVRVVKVVNRIEHDDMQNIAGQFALWAVNFGIDRVAFLKYTADEKLLNKVIQLLDSSGVKTILNRRSSASLTNLMSQNNNKNSGEYAVEIPVSASDKKPPAGLSYWFNSANIGYGFLIFLALMFVIYYILLITGVMTKFKNYMYPQNMDDDIDGLGDLA